MAELIRPSEYARRRGCSKQAVSQKIKSGGITLIDGKIDPIIADQQWLASTKQLRPDPYAATAYQAVVESAAESFNYNTARAKRETHDASMSELKLRQRAGELVELSDANYAMTDFGASIRSLIEQWPARLSPVLAAEINADLIRKMLTTECNNLIDEMRELAIKLSESLSHESKQRI